ncbi:MAG TPA: bacillithiol biosynthesis cysteine-adding enzyme BshC [Bacillales bacterium]|nr:bacillithiol biosynthesis cysteine-adding enzyme BshC [Bacillales bacterium]
MEINEINLPQKNLLASGYMEGDERVLSFFDYASNDQGDYHKRLMELQERTFPREALAEVLHDYNSRFSPSEAVVSNIERFKKPESVTVIGGQQAGVLTGPLYTIHKCLSILRLAEEKEERLGVPVIPIFWIAGEDHDFAEVNHTHVLNHNRVEKHTVPQSIATKQSVTEIKMEKDPIRSWVEEIIRSYGETKHTKSILRLLDESLRDSETYVDWFAAIIMHLFKEQGLVLLDSGDPRLRTVEIPFFKKMIENNRELNETLLNQIHKLSMAGLDSAIDAETNSANLFYHLNGERVLLERDEEGNFRGKNNECFMSEQEFLSEVETHPNRVSNNVVTRPLMQELLFPTLAFIAGPGEIAYWGTLKSVFHLFGCQQPLLVPRLNITLVDRRTEKWLKDQGFSVPEVLTDGTESKKERWLASRKERDIDLETTQVKNEINRAHEQMRSLAAQVDPHLVAIGEKNIGHLFRQIDYFADQIERSYRGRYERELAKFDRIEACLHPKNGLQERVWSVFPFLNQYGSDLVGRLTTEPFEFNGRHKIVFL